MKNRTPKIAKTFERVLKLLISALVHSFDVVQEIVFPYIGKSVAPSLTVLTYHSVQTGKKSYFEWQMSEMLKLAIPISIERMGRLTNNRRYVAVTFDDGFENVVINALPTLISKSIPAMIFITTGYMSKRPGWIEDSEHENAGLRLMAGHEVKSLPQPLIGVGSHTATHRRLSALTKRDIEKELAESKRALEDLLLRNIAFLSFPYGAYSSEVLSLCRKVGYEKVFLNVPVPAYGVDKGYICGRIDVSLNDWRAEFKLKVVGGYRWLGTAIALKHRVARLCRASIKGAARQE